MCLMLIKFNKEELFDSESNNLIFTEFDLRRCRSFIDGYSEFNVIYDIIPKIANDYFHNSLNYLSLPQESILFALGIKFCKISEIANELHITKDNVRLLIKKIIIKFLQYNKE